MRRRRREARAKEMFGRSLKRQKNDELLGLVGGRREEPSGRGREVDEMHEIREGRIRAEREEVT